MLPCYFRATGAAAVTYQTVFLHVLSFWLSRSRPSWKICQYKSPSAGTRKTKLLRHSSSGLTSLCWPQFTKLWPALKTWLWFCSRHSGCEDGVDVSQPSWIRCPDKPFFFFFFNQVEQVVLFSVQSQAGKGFGSSLVPSLFLWAVMIHFCDVLNFPALWAIHSQLPLPLHPSRGKQPCQ